MNIEDILSRLDIYEDENEKILRDYFKGKTSLEIIEEITKNKYNTKKCYIAIKTLLKDIDKNPDNIYSIIFKISKYIVENYDLNFLELFIINLYNNGINVDKIIFKCIVSLRLDYNICKIMSNINENINIENLSIKEEKYFGLSFEFDLQKSETYYLNQILNKLTSNEEENTKLIQNEFNEYFPYKLNSIENIISTLLYNSDLEDTKVYIAIKSLLNNCKEFNELDLFNIIHHINNLKNEELDKLFIFHLLNNNIIDENILNNKNISSRGEYLFKSVYKIYKKCNEDEKNNLLFSLEKDFIKEKDCEENLTNINEDIDNTLKLLTPNTKDNIKIINNLINKYGLTYKDLLYVLSKHTFKPANMYFAISTLLYCSNLYNIKIDPYYLLNNLIENGYLYTFMFLILINLKIYNFFGYEFNKYQLLNIFSKKFPYIKNDDTFISSLDIIESYNTDSLQILRNQAAKEVLKIVDLRIFNKKNNNFNINELYDKLTKNTTENYKIIKEYFKDTKSDSEIISNLFYYNLDYIKTYKAISSVIDESDNIKFNELEIESLIYLYEDNQKLFDLLILQLFKKYGYNDESFNKFLNTFYCKHLILSIIPKFKDLPKNEQEITLYEMEKKYINSSKNIKVNNQVSLVPVVNNKYNISKEDMKKIEKYGQLLNLKKYKTSMAVGREKELKSLIITLAQDKTCPIIVGDSGVGKTAIVDELAYRIQNNDIPDFLQNQLILEVSPSEVVSGCKYVGMFEENMQELLDICKKYNILLFIDEIHEMYGTGSGEKKDVDMADIIKRYISRDNGRVIGTTTKEEYLKHFSNDALKRRFDKIEVEEPNKVILMQIIEKVIEDFSNKNNIYFENENIENEIIKTIVDATSKLKPYNDKLCNPDLSIKLIDKAFAYAKVDNSKFITKEHFISSFEDTKWLYDSTIKSAVNRLQNIQENTQTKEKTLILNFNDYLK